MMTQNSSRNGRNKPLSLPVSLPLGLTEYSVWGLDPAVFRPAAAPVQLTAHKLRIGSNTVPFVLIGHLSWEAYGIGAACTISRSTIF